MNEAKTRAERIDPAQKARAAVPDERKLLFQTDLNRFWEIVTNDDSEARRAAGLPEWTDSGVRSCHVAAPVWPYRRFHKAGEH
jgi:hypothetical protein